MILFRTHRFDPEVRASCNLLAATSGMRLACLVDETHGAVDVTPFPKISINRAVLRRLGLLATSDAPWRCGDYGLYLALHEHPEVERFWLVEYDVRLRTTDPLSDFFSSFDSSPADLIAPILSARDAGWWWTPAMQVREEPVWGCLFPLLRASASLINAAWLARKRQARSPIYRLFWPNDESFLATTAARNGFAMEDLNERRTWYTDASFSFEKPWSGSDLTRTDPDGLIYHPVLYGDDFVRKLNKLAKPSTTSELARRKARKVLRRLL